MNMNKKNRKGFTIVELVIVIAVIAILAAVLVPTFSNVVGSANDAAIKQEVRNLYTEYVADAAAGGSYSDDVVIKIDNKYYAVDNGVLVGSTAGYEKPEDAAKEIGAQASESYTVYDGSQPSTSTVPSTAG